MIPEMKKMKMIKYMIKKRMNAMITKMIKNEKQLF